MVGEKSVSRWDPVRFLSKMKTEKGCLIIFYLFSFCFQFANDDDDDDDGAIKDLKVFLPRGHEE